AGAHERTLVGDQHHLVTFKQLESCDQVAVSVRALHGDNALTTPAVGREFVNGGPLTVTMLTGGKNHAAFLGNDQRYHMVIALHLDTTNTTGGPAHRPHLILAETYRLTGCGEQHDFSVAVSNSRANQGIAFVQVQGNQATAARTGEVRKRSILDQT